MPNKSPSTLKRSFRLDRAISPSLDDVITTMLKPAAFHFLVIPSLQLSLGLQLDFIIAIRANRTYGEQFRHKLLVPKTCRHYAARPCFVSFPTIGTTSGASRST